MWHHHIDGFKRHSGARHMNLSRINYLNYSITIMTVQVTDSTQVCVSRPASPFESVDAMVPYVWFAWERVHTYSRPRFYLSISGSEKMKIQHGTVLCIQTVNRIWNIFLLWVLYFAFQNALTNHCTLLISIAAMVEWSLLTARLSTHTAILDKGRWPESTQHSFYHIPWEAPRESKYGNFNDAVDFYQDRWLP